MEHFVVYADKRISGAFPPNRIPILGQARKLGWSNKGFRDFTPHLITHYTRVLEESQKKEGDLRGVVSDGYIDRMKLGLSRWIEGGQRCHLTWGVLHFVKS